MESHVSRSRDRFVTIQEMRAAAARCRREAARIEREHGLPGTARLDNAELCERHIAACEALMAKTGSSDVRWDMDNEVAHNMEVPQVIAGKDVYQ